MYRHASFFAALSFALVAPSLLAVGRVDAAPNRRVFGYIATGTPASDVRLDLVTDLAFSSEPITSAGVLSTTSWLGAGKTMIAAAHPAGVRVELVVNLFNSSGGSEIATFLASATAVQKGTQAIASAVQAAGGDGVSLDFEFVPSASKAAFVSFVQGVTTAVHAAVPGSDVSVALPGTNYPGYDIAGLAAAADTLMIMSYDFHYAGSDPGPVAPLADSTLWGAGSQTSSVALFKSKVADAHKLILGMPLYGYDYHAASSAVPGTHTAGTSASATEWSGCPALAAMYGRQWDSASSTPYLVYQSGSEWRQLWYEDAESLGLKIDLAVANDLGGIGLWSLTYADDSFWSVVQAKLTTPDDGGIDGGGVISDGGVMSDAGAPTDLSTSKPAPMVESAHGCELGGARGGDGGWWAILLLLGLLRRRITRAA